MNIKNLILGGTCLLLLLVCSQPLSAQRRTMRTPQKTEQSAKSSAVATLKDGKFRVAKESLNRKTPAGYKITDFRLIWSKNKKNYFLVQEVSSPKGRFNRFIPVAEKDGDLYVDMSRSSSFVDCWLMTCSTCDEEVSGSGTVYCACSVGGCENADTSDPVQDIAEKIFL